jgi:NitT/TauT family transport system permease protein
MRNLSGVVYPLISLAVIVVVWHVSVIALDVPSYVLPAPFDVARAFVNGFVTGLFWGHLWYTTVEVVVGYVLGSLLALVLGAALAESRTFERFVYPLILGLQAMPKVALAPLLLVWFGFGIESKIILVMLICFFPLCVNTVVGIRQTDPELIDLCRAFSTSRLYIFFNVKLPTAAGAIFAGLQVGVSLALIGAVVGEFIASQKGIGYMINASTVSMNVSNMFAGVFLLAFMGIAGAQLVRYLHRKVVFWEDEAGTGTGTGAV